MPSIGRLSRYRPPAAGRNGKTAVRVDAGVGEDSEISVYFDPLIAKLITFGPDRAGAVEAMAGALDRFVIDGIAHNQAFLAAIMANRRWQEGRLSTGFLAEEFPDGFAAVQPDRAALDRLAMVALAITLRHRHKFRALAGRLNGEGAIWRGDWVVAIGGTRIALHADPPQGPNAVRIGRAGGKAVVVTSDWSPGDPLWSGEIDGVAHVVQVRANSDGLHLSSRGVAVSARVMTPRVAELDALMPEKKRTNSWKQLRCPMPGLVIAIGAAEGQEVRAGEVLAVVEAMKMENVLRAERDATVKRIAVSPGDTLAVDAVIMEFA